MDVFQNIWSECHACTTKLIKCWFLLVLEGIQFQNIEIWSHEWIFEVLIFSYKSTVKFIDANPHSVALFFQLR